MNYAANYVYSEPIGCHSVFKFVYIKNDYNYRKLWVLLIAILPLNIAITLIIGLNSSSIDVKTFTACLKKDEK